MSAPFESGNVNSGNINSENLNNNSAVFESASGSPAVANSVDASPLSAEYNTAAVQPSQSARPPEASASASLSTSIPGENSAPLENSEANSAANSARESAAKSARESAAKSAANFAENTANLANSPANVISSTTSLGPSTYAPQPVVAPVPVPVPVPVSKGRSEKQLESDARAKQFRINRNPEYVGMFENIPQKYRPKGIPAWAARQAIEMDPEDQNAFVRNIASERRNAIEVKLGRKTRRVNPSTLNDIESILRMSEQSLIEKQPRSRALIRMFGRETRKIARNYTSEHINTLEPTLPTRQSRKALRYNNNASRKATNSLLGSFSKNKNNIINSLESTPRGSIRRSRSSNRYSPYESVSPYSNVSPPAYNE